MKLQITLGVLLVTQGVLGMEDLGRGENSKRLMGSDETDKLLAYLCGTDEDLVREMGFTAQLREKHRIPINVTDQIVRASEDELDSSEQIVWNKMVVRLLEIAGSNLETLGQDSDFINFPLHLALEHGLFSDMITLLLKGANYKIPDDKGRTPLHIIFSLENTRKRKDLIEKFLTVGTDLSKEDADGNTLLCLAGDAAVKGDENLMNYFLMGVKGISDPYIAKTLRQNNRLVVDKHSRCIVGDDLADPLRLQCLNYVVQQLFKVGSKTLKPTQHEHYFPSPLHLAVKHALVPCVYLLLYEGVDPNSADHLGRAPVHIASGLKDFDTKKTIIRKLLAAKAMVDIATKNGDTALTMVARQGDDRLVKFLLEHKANPNIHVHGAKQQNPSAHACGDSPLYAAATWGHITTVELLLQEKAKLKQSEQQALRFKLTQPEHKELKELLSPVIDKKIVRAYSK